MLVKAGSGFDERHKRALERQVRTRLGASMEVNIRQVDSIEREPNGKFRAVKSSVAGIGS